MTQFEKIATEPPASFDVSRPSLPALPPLVWVRIAMAPQFGVSYRAPDAKPETPTQELMGGTEHVVDIGTARKLVHQKRAVLLAGKDEYAEWPVDLLPVGLQERFAAQQLLEQQAGLR